jgi:hypothetical protein
MDNWLKRKKKFKSIHALKFGLTQPYWSQRQSSTAPCHHGINNQEMQQDNELHHEFLRQQNKKSVSMKK